MGGRGEPWTTNVRTKEVEVMAAKYASEKPSEVKWPLPDASPVTVRSMSVIRWQLS